MSQNSFFAVTESCPHRVPLEMIYEQIREVGVANVALSSDFDQTSNPPPVEGFAFYLEKMEKLGFSDEELVIMTRGNP